MCVTDEVVFIMWDVAYCLCHYHSTVYAQK